MKEKHYKNSGICARQIRGYGVKMIAIEFRGKNQYAGWVYGLLHYDKYRNNYFILDKNGDHWSTKKKYVGQFIGLHNKNGKIYVGDILKDATGFIAPITIDKFHGYRFMFGKDQVVKALENSQTLGNIHQNPELMEAK
jgi:hypothetical protein